MSAASSSNNSLARPVTMTIRGLCGEQHNITAVREALAELPGVTSVFVNPDSDFISLAYHQNRFSMAEFMKVFDRVGLPLG